MGKAPSAPNPTAVSAAQTQSNRETAISQAGLNATNQVTPYGNLEYSQIGTWSDGTPRFQATQTLSGAGQSLLNTGMQTQQNLANLAQEQSGRLSSLLGQNVDFSGLPQGGQWQNTDYSADRQRVENAMFERLNPQLDRQRQQLETDLVNRGIRPGSAAYSQAINDYGQNVNDQRTSILLNAGQEQSRLQNMQLNGFNAQNTQRHNSLNELLTQRNIPLNEILALSGQSQIQSPSFVNSPTTSVAGTDVAGITNNAYNSQMQAYNANQGVLGGLFSAGASLIPGLMGLSDRRAKQNIRRIGTADNGVPLYLWQYKGDEEWRVGPMAQDLLDLNPDAVEEGDNGYLYVDYAEAFA